MHADTACNSTDVVSNEGFKLKDSLLACSLLRFCLVLLVSQGNAENIAQVKEHDVAWSALFRNAGS